MVNLVKICGNVSTQMRIMITGDINIAPTRLARKSAELVSLYFE